MEPRDDTLLEDLVGRDEEENEEEDMVTYANERLAPSYPRSRLEYSRYRMSENPREAARKL